MPGDDRGRAPLPVTCIIPAYNSARYIADALDSVLGQTRPPAEIIVVDDGSADDTVAAVTAYGPRVSCIVQETAGPAATRNTGIGAATRELIAFLDADDRWHPEKLERQFEYMRANPDLDVCVTQAQNFWDEELAEEAERLRDHPRAGAIPGYVSGGMLAHQRAFDRVGRFNPELWFGDSADWFMRAKSLGVSVHCLDEVLLYHRMHANNITRRLADRSKAEWLRILRGNIASGRSDGP